MTREEAKEVIEDIIIDVRRTTAEEDKALRMAIEALSEPKTIIGIDIPYGSDKGFATVFKGNEKMVLGEVKEIMSVVRCKDCRFYWGNLGEDDTDEMYGECRWDNDEMPNADDFCSYGERREE